MAHLLSAGSIHKIRLVEHLTVHTVPRRSSDASRYLRRGTAEYQDVDGCTEVSGPARGRGDERTAGRKRGEKKPPGGFKDHGAVLFSRKRLIEASARTGAPLPPASRIHPRLPAADPPNTHPSCAASPREAERGGASPAAQRSPRRSPPVPHGLFGFIYGTAHRSLASGPRKDFIPPPAPASSSHTHAGHIARLGDGSARVPTARTRRSAARQTDG
ncbi:unnamed protein product [Coccothraustes coccothraustes]